MTQGVRLNFLAFPSVSYAIILLSADRSDHGRMLSQKLLMVQEETVVVFRVVTSALVET